MEAISIVQTSEPFKDESAVVQPSGQFGDEKKKKMKQDQTHCRLLFISLPPATFACCLPPGLENISSRRGCQLSNQLPRSRFVTLMAALVAAAGTQSSESSFHQCFFEHRRTNDQGNRNE